ncbi:D-alanine--D-alanine ligase [Salipaludibacillus neizhouensis]|uniref:D-alanine--D-alanine ligase n=2 Tax=Salipaludibacillus neizhouensis TaxID=885475 RepID=A0A3A9KYJ0_9BACI|nr:D-alanine--D-alanine ligase [Salipaludibacillus neizhouensis]RKL69406.1 D-alanine--D-alanine ligase [Salipaludibacillus neizhouensis]
MMKLKVGLLFGGKSPEHQVSLQSAKSVFEAIDKDKYEILLIGIDKEGKWNLYDNLDTCLLNNNNPNLIELKKSDKSIALVPGELSNQFLELPSGASLGKIDVIFPLVHGGLGEDGSMQGLLRFANIPFVGPGVLASAVSMDKDVAKRLLSDAGLRVAHSLTFTRKMKDTIAFKKVKKKLGTPMFIKPANHGSSVGVSKVESKEEFYQGINHAFCYDQKIIVEEAIVGREIECAVLGNDEPISSLPGEILTQNTFYSYDAKYIDEKGAQLTIPAVLEDIVIQEIKEKAIKAFKVLHCEGLARIDFFLTQNQKLIINEINTLPGFTKQSMYPKLWEVSGIQYKELINTLISLAIERHQISI